MREMATRVRRILKARACETPTDGGIGFDGFLTLIGLFPMRQA